MVGCFILETKPGNLYIRLMLQLKLSDVFFNTTIFTLTENVSIVHPYYLCVFTHVLTKETVILLFDSALDESPHPERYNEYSINTVINFGGKPPGEWHYVVYEQASSSNQDIAATGAPLEYGKLLIERATEFEFEKYDSPTSYKTYNG